MIRLTTASSCSEPAAAPDYNPRHHRRILCVFPRYAHSFGTFQYSYALMPGVRAFMPPQGILLIAAYMPSQWEVRFVDENMRHVSDADVQWADAVCISGMHVQRRNIQRVIDLAHRHAKLAIVGGPSVSGCPEYYPDADILHVGELGDATDELVKRLDTSVERPVRQVVLQTAHRLPLERFPTPAYHLLNLRHYFLGSIQYSSGCPFLCEFCDIPALYGRQPRTKTPRQIVAELDLMLHSGARTGVYFVDDNFIANPAATRALLPHLIDWQRRSGYRIRFSCEATLNLAQFPDILQMMREAQFVAVFVGIETPEAHALSAIQKKQNMRLPILQAIATLNRHGLEVVSGIILGLDTDTPDTGRRILEFIDTSKIPMLTINMLYALPKTPLYARLQREGRLVHDLTRETNVEFKLPYPTVVKMWHDVIAEAYEPRNLYDRFAAQAEVCFPNRIVPRRTVTADMVRFGLGVMRRTFWNVGVRSDYRRIFWRTVLPLIRQGRIDDVIHIGVVTHHLIRFARDCRTGHAEASFYADPSRNAFSDAPAPSAG